MPATGGKPRGAANCAHAQREGNKFIVWHSAIGTRRPQDVANAIAVDVPPKDEEMIGKPIEIFESLRVDGLARRQRRNQPLGASCYGAREVEMGGAWRAARQDEAVERLERGVERV